MSPELRHLPQTTRVPVRAGYRAVVVAAAVAFSAAALLAGCSGYDSVTQRIAQRITPYRVTIVQGNFVSREAVAKLRTGMSRDEVKATLGTPLLVDMFHADRWDYVFYFKRGSTQVVQQRDLVVYFDATGHLARWTGGDDLPSEQELLAEIDGDRKAHKPVKPEQAAASQPEAASTPASAPAADLASAPAAASATETESAPAVQPADTGGFGLRAPASSGSGLLPAMPSGSSGNGG